ncbi:MAG TPA: GntR family transcriptional regulator [Candidatus Anaerotruncus excrementipullorum]|uniref:GntR family transcriptional regulator n=1 Tax=Candidatus Anaerotruncus excrementipullorum TaxID=2838465 RepID=A0A9D1WSZ7_9FIRM|nr:GntR family transcriptional regulator [Candidatus Anaerotruncus excrementipullorum]
MSRTVKAAQYLQIALDIATRIARGELAEGSRIYGRSVMSSEYSVSPETIRRALRLLADMKVVEVKPQSGAVVLSADSARRYIERFGASVNTQALQARIQQLLAQNAQTSRELADAVGALVRSRETFTAAAEPLPNYEVPVPPKSPLIGKSIGAIKFWQSTGGTIVAIRRGQTVILSPGPYAELYAGDVVVLVGSPAAAQAARHLLMEQLPAPAAGGAATP